METFLTEIAIERILTRLAQARTEEKQRAIGRLQAAANHELLDPQSIREAAKTIRKTLFPELE